MTPTEQGGDEMTTDNTQEHMHNSGEATSCAQWSAQAELDEIMDKIYDLAYDHLPDRGIAIGTDRIKQSILDWHNKQAEQIEATAYNRGEVDAKEYWQEEARKQVEAVLDRLEAEGQIVDTRLFKREIVATPHSAIEAERDKLKGEKQ